MANRFTEPPHEDAKPIVTWALTRKKVRDRQIVIGGLQKRELRRAGDAIRRFLIEVERRGRLLDIGADAVNRESAQVESLFENYQIQDADDPHIIALARLSGSRLLFTEDARSFLIDLFRDRRFLDPPGKIYKSKANASLLKNPAKCKDLRKSKKQQP